MTRQKVFDISVIAITLCGLLLSIGVTTHRLATGQEPAQLIDYKSLTTNQDKLAACQSLLTDLINEYNRQAAVASQNATYNGKFHTYVAEYFTPTLKLILHERNTLKDLILSGLYTPEAWHELSKQPELDYYALCESIFGDKAEQGAAETIATSPAIAALEKIDLGSLLDSEGFDPKEDYTTYTEYDEGSDITVTDADTITITAAETRDDSYWVYYDKGAAHFDGDFEHRYELVISAVGSPSYAWVVGWYLGNTAAADWKDLVDASGDGFALNFAGGDAAKRVYLYECDGGTVYNDYYGGDWSLSTRYYLTVERDEAVGSYGTLYAYICTGNYYGEGGSSTVDTLSVGLHTSKKDLRYVYALSSYDSGDGSGYTATGIIENLDLQEASPPSVDTDAADDLEDTTATLNGDVTNINDTSIDTRGFVWDTSTHGAPSPETAPADSDYTSYWTEAGSFGTGVFDHGVTSLATATLHYFRAAAENDNSLWGYGDELTFLTKPAAPTNVAATDGVHTDKVVVTWTKSSGTVTGYKIYRDAGLIDTVGDVATYDDTGADAPTITPGAASATDGLYQDRTRCTVSGESANDGTTHTYKVRAYNDTGDSDDSATDTGYRGKSSLNYNWYKSWPDAASNYTAVGNYSEPYDDMSPAIYPSGRYYFCAFNMTGAAAANSTADRGYAQSSNITVVYVYPEWQSRFLGLNATVWVVAWAGDKLATNQTVSWNTSGVGEILWCENVTGSDGRADCRITTNTTGNQTVGCSGGAAYDEAICLWVDDSPADLPTWYFAILGVAIIGAWYTKEMILYIMATVACGGMVWWARNSTLESETVITLTAIFVIIAAVMIFGMLRHGQFGFVRGGDSE